MTLSVQGLFRLGARLVFGSVIGLAGFGGLASSASAEATFVSMGTGAVSGVYYPTGRSICSIVNAAMGKDNFRCSAEATPGSVYNVEALLSGEIEFALVQSDVQYLAVKGDRRWRGHPAKKLRAVMSLYPELLTIVARADAGISDIEGLKGKRVNIGAPGSGTRATWDEVEHALGLTRRDLSEATELTSEAAADRLCSGELDASVLIVGHPSKMVASELSACHLTLVPASGQKIDKLIADKPYYIASSIPASMYGLASDTATFGSKATLLTSADVPDEVVYEFTKAVIQNLDRLKAQQPSLKEVRLGDMVRQSLSAPLHPGAEKVYRELGLYR